MIEDQTPAIYILPQQLMREMLDNSCSNPWYPPDYNHTEEYKKMVAEDDERSSKDPKYVRRNFPPPPGGWFEYRIETHCVAFIIVARKRRNKRTKKYTWQILQFRTEPC